MKNIKRLALSLLLSVIALQAQGDLYETKSLVAIEGGYNFNDNSTIERVYGFKVGAESKDNRIFLAARHYDLTTENFYAYGVEFQHFLNFSKYVNLYVGISGGVAHIQESNKKIYKEYYGGDMGFNFHLHQFVDFEAGIKTIKIERLKSPSIGYVSCIIKYNMD